MNNSKLAVEYTSLHLEEPVDTQPILIERETKIVRIIDAIRSIQGTREWKTLKEEVFDSLADTLEKQMNLEARKEIPDTLKLNRLAGQLKWAEKYSDLSKLEQIFKTELTNIKQLYGKT